MKEIFIFGYPVKHSKSPQMQNNAFLRAGLDYTYKAIEVVPQSLEENVDKLRSDNIAGANITIPHKTEVIKYLDEISERSKLFGAVNTIINKEGVLYGTSTDSDGILDALLNKGIDPSKKKVCIIGAGGSGRTALYTLSAMSDSSVTLCARSRAKAEILLNEFENSTTKKASFAAIGSEKYFDTVSESDIIINATPIGMEPDIASSPVPEKLIKSSHTVFDFVYAPRKTTLLCYAEKKGAETIEGIDMLIFQGMKSFEMWTEVKAQKTWFSEVFNF